MAINTFMTELPLIQQNTYFRLNNNRRLLKSVYFYYLLFLLSGFPLMWENNIPVPDFIPCILQPFSRTNIFFKIIRLWQHWTVGVQDWRWEWIALIYAHCSDPMALGSRPNCSGSFLLSNFFLLLQKTLNSFHMFRQYISVRTGCSAHKVDISEIR